jgi:hypothetical protein
MPNAIEKSLAKELRLPSWKALYNPQVYWGQLSENQRMMLDKARRQ